MEQKEQSEFYSPPLTVGLTVLIYFAAQLLAGILVSIVPVAKGWTNQQIADWLQSNPWATFGFIALMQFTAVLLVHMFLKLRHKTFRFIGLDNPKVKYLIYAVAGYGLYFLLYLAGLVAAKLLLPGLDLNQEQEIGFSTSTSGWGLLPIFVSLVVLPPLVEEIVTRGFLYGGLRTKLPYFGAAVITSLLFAAAHLNGAKEGLLWVAALDTFILSLVLCYLREKTGSLWPPIGVHMLKNALAFAVLFNIVQYFR